MKTIYGYSIPKETAFRLDLPKGARILCVQFQAGNDAARLWAEVDDDEVDEEPHWFFIVGTGRERPEEARHYIGTWQEGRYVWHLYSGENLRG